MAGSCRVGAELLNPWYFPQIIQHWMLVNPKGSSKFFLNVGYGDKNSIWNAKSQSNAPSTQLIVVPEGCFHSSLISLNKNPVFKKSLMLLVTCASSFPSFTVNSILLSSSGVQLKNICRNTVITPSTHSRPTFQKPLTQLNSKPYRSGKSAKNAQFEVKKYGSRKYKSHRKVSESVAQTFDRPSTN